MSADYRTLLDGLHAPDKRATIASDELSACEVEVVLLMREVRKRNKGKATFIIEYFGTAWHVLEAKPPIHVKL